MAAAPPTRRLACGHTRVIPSLLLLSLCLPALTLHAADDAPRPEPMVFMPGLQGPGAVEIIQAINTDGACLNTIYYDLPVDASEDLAPVREAIAEAHAAGLKVIIGLPTRLDATWPVTAGDRQYVDALASWLQAVVGGLAGTEGISAWATDHYLERDINYSDEGLREFLLARHGSLGAINTAWGSQFRSVVEITRDAIGPLDDDQTHGVGRPSVDLAEYQRTALREVLALWAREIRRHDPDTPLMTGRISLYRTLTAIPGDYDIVQPHFPPDVLEPDVQAHNVHGVSIARMAGRFDVIPWLRAPLPPSDAYRDSALYDWIVEAGMRGAVGVGIEDWSRIAEVAAWRNNTLTSLRAALAQRPFEGPLPRPTAAVVYEPYAGGHEFFGAPAWGFIEGFPERGLAELAINYRLGSIFGGLDYLTIEDLPEADLSGYSTLLMPTCLSVPPSAADALQRYVESGGTLLADLGVGMYEAGSWAPTQSPLAVLLGIAGAIEPADRLGSFLVGETHPAFPSAKLGMEAQGLFVPSEGISTSVGHLTQRRFEGAVTETTSYAFQGPSWYIRPASNATPLATQGVRFDEEQRPHFMGLTVATVGSGLSVFAPFSAWSWWPPDDPLHAGVHCDLLSRRARYRLMSGLLVDTAVGLSGSDDWLHLFRRVGEGPVEVLAGAADHRAFLGATTTFSAEERTADGARSGIVRLGVDLPARSLRHCEALPVRLRPEVGECQARIGAYSRGLLMMEVGGNKATWGRERRGDPERFYGGSPTAIRITVDSGLYPIEPGSTHQVALLEGADRSNGMTFVADHRGRLDFWITTAGGRVEIYPARE
jgi:hypothetical protein